MQRAIRRQLWVAASFFTRNVTQFSEFRIGAIFDTEDLANKQRAATLQKRLLFYLQIINSAKACPGRITQCARSEMLQLNILLR